MLDVISTITGNVGVGFENIIMIVIFSGLIIFAAKDFKIMLLLGFIFSGLTFMWFYAKDLNWVPPLIIMFIFIVLLSFSLYASASTTQSGGGII